MGKKKNAVKMFFIFVAIVAASNYAYADNTIISWKSDMMAPIKTIYVGDEMFKLCYHYRIHGVIFLPYWTSFEGYVVENEDGHYAPLGEFVNENVQKKFEINTPIPAVPWVFEKYFAYIIGFIIYWILGLGVAPKIIRKWLEKKGLIRKRWR
jgi:hypothetical protein